MMNTHFQCAAAFIENLKRTAKIEKKAIGSEALASYQDKIARIAGFQNWSLLHNRLVNLDPVSNEYDVIRRQINSGITKAMPTAGRCYVLMDTRDYMHSKYLKQQEVDFVDPASIVDVKSEIISAFGKIYPEEILLIAIDFLEKESHWHYDDDISIEEFYVSDSQI